MSPEFSLSTIYLGVGTFTLEGNFDAIIPCLDGLNESGVTAIELMPVAQFPGSQNWGYDGVYPFANAPASATLPIPAGHWCKRLDSADKQWQGNGNSVPEQLDLEQEATLTLSPKSFVLFTLAKEA